MTSKYERLAEIKADYDFTLKRLTGEKFAEKRAKVISEKESALAACKREMELSKKQQLEDVKTKYAKLRSEINATKTSKLDDSRATMRSSSFSLLGIRRSGTI